MTLVLRARADITLDAVHRVAWQGEDVCFDEGARARMAACREAFLEQAADARRDILGGLPAISLEAGVTLGWADIVGREGLSIGIDGYGASAPWQDLAQHFGFTPQAVATTVGEWLGVE